jgi:phosphatidylglycerophosphate synthase
MESIYTLREITQKEKLENRERPWGYRLFQRGPSIFITRILLATPIKPNYVTVLSILFGIMGTLCLLSPDWHIKLLGFFFFYINLLLDRVDGEIARYKKIYSLKGIYMDEINHLIVPPLFFLGLAWGLANQTIFRFEFVIALGTFAALGSIFIRAGHGLPYQIFLKKYNQHTDIMLTSQSTNTITDIREQHHIIYPFVKIFHQFQDFFITIFIFALVLVGEHYSSPSGFLFLYTSYLLIIYALYLPLIFLENIWKGIRTIESRMKDFI